MKINNKPKNTVVLKMANLSNPFETLYAKIWVIVKIEIEKNSSDSYEKYPVEEEQAQENVTSCGCGI